MVVAAIGGLPEGLRALVHGSLTETWLWLCNSCVIDGKIVDEFWILEIVDKTKYCIYIIFLRRKKTIRK